MSGKRSKKIRKIVRGVFYQDFFEITGRLKLFKRIDLAWRIVFKKPYEKKRKK